MRLWSAHEIASLDAVARDLWSVVTHLRDLAAPGVTGLDVDAEARVQLDRLGLTPAFPGFARHDGAVHRGAICVSVNADDPDSEPMGAPFREGDVLTIDVAASRDGWTADLATSRGVGHVGEDARRTLVAAAEATDRVIRGCVPGADWSEIVEDLAAWATGRGVTVTPGFSGHGVGRRLHEPPALPYTPGEVTTPVTLRPGMVFTIEPVVATGACSAFEERVVAVTNDGPLIIGATVDESR